MLLKITHLLSYASGDELDLGFAGLNSRCWYGCVLSWSLWGRLLPWSLQLLEAPHSLTCGPFFHFQVHHHSSLLSVYVFSLTRPLLPPSSKDPCTGISYLGPSGQSRILPLFQDPEFHHICKNPFFLYSQTPGIRT